MTVLASAFVYRMSRSLLTVRFLIKRLEQGSRRNGRRGSHDRKHAPRSESIDKRERRIKRNGHHPANETWPVTELFNADDQVQFRPIEQTSSRRDAGRGTLIRRVHKSTRREISENAKCCTSRTRSQATLDYGRLFKFRRLRSFSTVELARIGDSLTRGSPDDQRMTNEPRGEPPRLLVLLSSYPLPERSAPTKSLDKERNLEFYAELKRSEAWLATREKRYASTCRLLRGTRGATIIATSDA